MNTNQLKIEYEFVHYIMLYYFKLYLNYIRQLIIIQGNQYVYYYIIIIVLLQHRRIMKYNMLKYFSIQNCFFRQYNMMIEFSKAYITFIHFWVLYMIILTFTELKNRYNLQYYVRECLQIKINNKV